MQYLAFKEKNEAPLESQKKEEVEEVAQRSGSPVSEFIKDRWLMCR
jgi:hypothetical protein